jgi:hypothetical protein
MRDVEIVAKCDFGFSILMNTRVFESLYKVYQVLGLSPLGGDRGNRAEPMSEVRANIGLRPISELEAPFRGSGLVPGGPRHSKPNQKILKMRYNIEKG